MVDPLPSLIRLKESYEGLDKAKKNHIKLSFTILMLGMGLFFYFVSENNAYAQKADENLPVLPDIIDPLHKIGKGINIDALKNSCEGDTSIKKEETNNNPKISDMLAGSPMENMVAALNKRNGEVASYLIAIAKKESDFGKHSPRKGNKECYNYWGYRGGYNATESGYSCFDSPEQAIQSVGDRIENLLDKKVDTPEKMVIWKCGSDCNAAGGQEAANKWVSDVKSVYKKLNS